MPRVNPFTMRFSHVAWLLIRLIGVAASSSAYDVTGAIAIPENDSIRRMMEQVIVAPVREAVQFRPRIEIDPVSGSRVRFEVAEQNDAVYFMFINHVRGVYPVAGPGNWIIKRDADGEFVQAKVFLQSSEKTFLRVFPDGSTSTLDVYLEGVLIHSAVVIRLPFERILYEPLERIVELTRYRIDWAVFLPRPQRAGDAHVSAVADSVRSYLPSLSDSDDGALDSDGTFRFIEDLTENLASGFNCSGFAKWVVDGVVYPVSGTYLSINALKEKHLELRGHAWSVGYEASRDPYFGLDWTRNLATEYRRAQGISGDTAESADVRDLRWFEYVEDVGYEIADLGAILYLLAVDRPGSIYLGSVNRMFGSGPALRQHVHVAVFFPYFDRNGVFRIDIMERNLETGVESLQARYPTDYLHLVELRVDGRFSPFLP